MYEWCANDVGCTEVKDRAYASEIPDVVEAQASKWRNLIGKGEMGIKDETKFASWGWGTDWSTITVLSFSVDIDPQHRRWRYWDGGARAPKVQTSDSGGTTQVYRAHWKQNPALCAAEICHPKVINSLLSAPIGLSLQLSNFHGLVWALNLNACLSTSWVKIKQDTFFGQ